MIRKLVGVPAVLVLALILSVADTRHARANDCERGGYDGAYAGEVLLPQNWSCAERQAFWFTDQGSELIPYSWFLHLEQATSEAKFGDPNHMDRFRYLPQQPTALNPDGLPIGFTRGSAAGDSANGAVSEAWLGMNCAACHTGQIEHDGKAYLIDGAPTMGDFEGMLTELVRAMRTTLLDPAKFARFAEAVMAEEAARGSGGTMIQQHLKKQLAQVTSAREAWNQRNRGVTPYGHARLDAVGAIFNEVAVTGLDQAANLRTANAPVSYPFLWDTPQHDFIQWNGAIQNKKMGSVIRNVGEVLGVFGTLELNGDPASRSGHVNSIDMTGLAELETLLVSLWSPRWQDTGLPAIDQALASKGERHFARLCQGCHRPITRDDPGRDVKAMMIPAFNPGDPADPRVLGTDPTAALNFLTRTADVDKLAGHFTRYWRASSKGRAFGGEGDPAQTAGILGYAVFGVITKALHEDPKGTLEAMKAGQPKEVAEGIDRASGLLFALPGTPGVKAFWEALAAGSDEIETDPSKPACFPAGILPCYKARALNGIWATAPYLHNGSVRTLRQLLTPPDQREAVFQVGTRSFDPADVGFVSEGASTLDTRLPGNANRGHVYGTRELAENPGQLDELLEYLKSL